MANPMPAFAGTECALCCDEITEGENVYLFDGDTSCQGCAEVEGIVCVCGSFKKPEYDECYHCAKGT
jgi:hypothetical protein